MRRIVALSLWMVIALGALVVVLFAATLYTYHRLADETRIAELRFDRTGERRFAARLRTGERCEEQVFPVMGEQFRIDAEFVKWKYWATLLGLDSHYRLDRLEGRYTAVSDQNTQPTLAHDLRGRTALDVVEFAAMLGSWNFLLDASYGSSTYQEIDVARVYSIYRTQTGIITRSVPRTTDLTPGTTFTVTIDGACTPPSVFERAATATDGAAVAVIDWLTN